MSNLPKKDSWERLTTAYPKLTEEQASVITSFPTVVAVIGGLLLLMVFLG